MSLFSDTKHTLPGIFILESPPWAFLPAMIDSDGFVVVNLM